MHKYAVLRGLVSALIALPLVLGCVPVFAQESSSTYQNATTGDEVLDAVLQARAVLQAKVDDAQAKPHKAVVVKSKDVALPITLAVWDETNKQLIYVEAKRAGKVVTVTSGQPWQIRVTRDNGVNSQFEILGQPQLHVLVIVHPVFTSVGTSRKPRFQVESAVYVPYSDFILRPAIIAAGKSYLNKNIQAVYDELRTLGVRSRSFPDRSLADAINPVVVKTIIAIEHVGGDILVTGNVATYLQQFYVTLATNQNVAYSYAKSVASARGLVQFIPSTYKMLARLYPELSLNVVFEQGMADPYNAIKAEVGLLDSSLTILPSKIRNQFEGDDFTIGSYLAAIYNGGGTRVLRAIRQWDGDWALSQTSHSSKLKSDIASAKAEIKKLKAELKKKLTAAQKKDLQTQLSQIQAKLTRAQASYKTVSSNSLKLETVKYVAKFKIFYQTLLND